MKDIQVQPWWQCEDDITMFSEHREGGNEQGTCATDQQELIQVGRQQDTRNHNNYNMWNLQDGWSHNANSGTKDTKC
eukprot:6489641-Amphidinium_carterae.1